MTFICINGYYKIKIFKIRGISIVRSLAPVVKGPNIEENEERILWNIK